MSLCLKTFHFMLLVSGATAASLQGTPKMLTVLADKDVKSWSGDVQNVPDGKMFMMRKDPNDKNAGFIINTTPNNFISSSSSSINDISGPYNDPKAEYQNSDSGANFVLLPNDVPIPDASITGLRGNGTLYDEGTVWIFNAFRLSATSQPGADSDSLIGFEHNEDYWKDTGTTSSCTYKSIAVRYSKDLGKSWTRSVPIITKNKQNETCDDSNPFTGTGDFATMWNPDKKEWVTIAQEGPLVMSTSKDPLAKPGTWTRIDPVTNSTDAGFIGNGTTLAHGDLASIGGSNPSIIRDEKNSVWHMIYAKWGGGMAYTKSTDLYRWDTPYLIWDNSDMTPVSQYPTLVGDEGDTLTTDGTATLYFTAQNHVDWGRPLWSVGIDFGANSSSSASNSTILGSSTNPTSSTAVAQTATSSGISSSSLSGATISSAPVALGDDEDDECDSEL